MSAGSPRAVYTRVSRPSGRGLLSHISVPQPAGRGIAQICRGRRPRLETLAAASILRAKLPDLRVRVVNVVDLMRLLRDSELPHGLPDSQFNTLVTEDRPVIFAFHGYPWLVHRLTYRRRNHDQMHVRGYKEKGTTTTLTSASINPGNSCGALLNASGQVIGIPALAAASPQGGSLARSIGFATPFRLARDIARQIIASGRVITSRRAAPGAQIATLTGPGRQARQDRDRRGHRREPRRQGRPACR